MKKDIEPQVFNLGQEIYPFQAPIRNWHGYSDYPPIRPAIYTEIKLIGNILPDMNFFTVVEGNPRRDNFGLFWVEADKNQLEGLGLIERAPLELPLPMPNADSENGRWGGYYILNPETISQIRKLRLEVSLPEEKQLAVPHIHNIDMGAERIYYARGVDFDQFTHIGKGNKRAYPLSVDIRNRGYLEKIKVVFSKLD